MRGQHSRPWRLAGVAAVAVLLLAGAAGEQGRSDVPGPPSGPFDPVEAALGIDTKAERRQYEQGVARITSRKGPPEAAMADGDGHGATEADVAAAAHGDGPTARPDDPLLRADAAFQAAIDDLYAEVATTDAAEAGRAVWRDCMAKAGHPYESPNAVTDAILDSGPSGPSDAEWQDVLDTQEVCGHAAHRGTALHDAVRAAFPGWAARHGETIQAYADALGLDR